MNEQEFDEWLLDAAMHIANPQYEPAYTAWRAFIKQLADDMQVDAGTRMKVINDLHNRESLRAVRYLVALGAQRDLFVATYHMLYPDTAGSN